MTEKREKSVGFIIVTVGHWDLVEACVKSIYETYPFKKEIFVLPNLHFEKSLSQAINDGIFLCMDSGVDYICYLNDDVVLGHAAVEQMIDKVMEGHQFVHHAAEDETSGYYFWVADPFVFSRVGMFDYLFYPAYFEDNDWNRRANLLSESIVDSCAASCTHVGSATLKRFSEAEVRKHHRNFDKNKERYIAKWGGEPGEEKFTVPYDIPGNGVKTIGPQI